MMRRSITMLAAAASIAPTIAQANDCPAGMSDEVEAALGETVAWLEAGQTVHTPAGLTMLDKPVSYVIAKRSAEGERIQQLDYRFNGLIRPADQEYPSDLRKAFDKAFNSSVCGKDRDPVCAITFSNKEGGGRLSGGKLSVGDLWIPDDARGPALQLVKADENLGNGDPVFLICLY
ncbi:hypothetical protein GRI75_01400 [Altererythrobacter soli]|uniref:Uncharacterized protein n=1 Tax=Croceibacterium soli TaxID=1739690 RepID=A0A6I4UNH6_9SPHN|nr:hypothetical protein [Croceibacterium soli]MXP40298.1 hypothetical protein [Croceibacterium soli]